MGDAIRPNIEKGAEDPPPPPYTQNASVVIPQESQALQDYESQPPTRLAANVTPYRSFPSVMNAYYQWNLAGIKTFHICGTNRDERLYAVEMHTGFSGKPPLGTNPGVLLHNGTSSKDPVLAAAGAESQFAERYAVYSPESLIMLPALLPYTNIQQTITETMRSYTTDNNGAAFLFSVEVGGGDKMRRENFEWRKIKKGNNEEAKEGGFELLRVLSLRQQSAIQSITVEGSSSSKEEGTSSSSTVTKNCSGDVVALFAWTKTWSHLDHPFTLRLLAALGERWALMVLMTALRLWVLHAKGKTSSKFIAKGEQSGGKY